MPRNPSNSARRHHNDTAIETHPSHAGRPTPRTIAMPAATEKTNHPAALVRTKSFEMTFSVCAEDVDRCVQAPANDQAQLASMVCPTARTAAPASAADAQAVSSSGAQETAEGRREEDECNEPQRQQNSSGPQRSMVTTVEIQYPLSRSISAPSVLPCANAPAATRTTKRTPVPIASGSDRLITHTPMKISFSVGRWVRSKCIRSSAYADAPWRRCRSMSGFWPSCRICTPSVRPRSFCLEFWTSPVACSTEKRPSTGVEP